MEQTIFEKNLNAIAATTTLFVIASKVKATDEMLNAVNGAILSTVNRKFAEDNEGAEFLIEKHEIPTDYLAEAFARLMLIARMAEMAVKELTK